MPLINNYYQKLKKYFSAHFPKMFVICDKYKSIVKFIFAGGTAGLVNLVLLYLFHGLFAWDLIFSTSLAFISAFLVSFTLQKFWTFRNDNKKKIPVQFVLYLGNSFLGLSLNGYFMHLLVNNWGIWYILAQIIVNLSLGVYNFFVYKFVIFRFKESNISEHEDHS